MQIPSFVKLAFSHWKHKNKITEINIALIFIFWYRYMIKISCCSFLLLDSWHSLKTIRHCLKFEKTVVTYNIFQKLSGMMSIVFLATVLDHYIKIAMNTDTNCAENGLSTKYQIFLFQHKFPSFWIFEEEFVEFFLSGFLDK